jgi:hypothetical protein
MIPVKAKRNQRLGETTEDEPRVEGIAVEN